MSLSLSLLFLSLSALSLTTSNSLTCREFMADKPAGLPCVQVSRCDNNTSSSTSTSHGTLQITESATGSGPGKSLADVSLCFDDTRLLVTAALQSQFFLTDEAQFSQCNDAVFNENVFEFFIAPYNAYETAPQCYSELDVSPNDVMFQAGIYNENLNHTGIVGHEMDCAQSGVSHNTHIVNTQQKTMSWTASLSFPFSLLNCPYGCPSKTHCGTAAPLSVYRINAYRINELSPVSKCSSTTCEYLAWSPTLVTPPAFHEPTKFGYMLLQL